jgi:HTH-type transcriptional regulator / antitoxin HipB
MTPITKKKFYTLEEMKDKHIGERGTPRREAYEYELRMEIIGDMIKKARQERNLTQEALGVLIGVQKAQISKLERNANSATVDTILRVFKALQAEVSFSVKMEGETLQLS